jgi:hypothetical protein
MRYLTLCMTLVVLMGTVMLNGCGRDPKDAGKTAFKVEKDATEKIAASSTATTKAEAAERANFKVLRVYTDANSPDNHYAPSGWMGDYGDISLSNEHMENPHSGATCIKIGYSAKKSQGANWAGIYWQSPPNNWGAKDGGFDLNGASRLVFWARGDKGGEKIEEFRSGGIPGEYADSDVAGIGPIELGAEWTEYAIDLTGKDMSSIIGGFMWSANVESNPDGFTIYLDDIRYE